MFYYILKRLFLIVPTLFGILLLNFIIIQMAPGGPIQQVLSKMRSGGGDVDQRLGGGATDIPTISNDPSTMGEFHGEDPELIKKLEKQFGFDKPFYERFITMSLNFLSFDFGNSYFKGERVSTLIASKLPVSFSLGLWTSFLIYFISIPLGIVKASRHGSRFDVWSSSIIVVCYAIPGFLLGLFLIIFFAGGSFINLFPLRGLTSDHFSTLSLFGKVGDYLWHITLPVIAIVVGGVAKITLLIKNSFLEEIHKAYVVTARSKGLTERAILIKHVFRNAVLVLISGFPAMFAHLFITSNLLIEVLFSLDGLGLLGFEATLQRDYPIMFATLFIFTLISMGLQLIGDILYTLVDPRIRLSK